MILSKTRHGLGVVYRHSNSGLEPQEEALNFLNVLLRKVSQNNKHGIDVTCLELKESDFPKFFYDRTSECAPLQERIHELSGFLKASNHRLFFFLSSYYYFGSQLTQPVEDTREIVQNIYHLLEDLGIQYPAIILKIGSAYGKRKETMARFVEEINCLEPEVRKVLAVTNDDKPSLFSVTDLLSGIFYPSGIPICFRTLAHNFNTGDLSVREALFLSCSTWQKGIKPIFLHAESLKVDPKGVPLSPLPSEDLKYRIPVFGLDVDVAIECPTSFETAVKYLGAYQSLKPLVIDKDW